MKEKYDFNKIESKWQKIWDEKKDIWQAKDFGEKPKYYTLFEFPYPSGEGLHMGHLRGQTAVDVISRKKRLEGFNVMTPIGWDAFGLPTENYAIKHKIHPSVATANNISKIKEQEKMLGYLLDWDREINTSDPKYYRWTQWIFLQFYKHGLAYKKLMPINWCPSCKIGLANEEVIGDKCERCGTEVEKREINQWMLKITAYADKLIEGLKDVDYPEPVKLQQINWIGKSEVINSSVISTGLEESSDDKISRQARDDKEKSLSGDLIIPVFTSRADTIFGVTAIVLAPEHPLATKLCGADEKEEVLKYIAESKKKSNIERTSADKNKTGIFIGSYAEHPLTGEKIPLWVADYVLADYGTGAVMMVPAHDDRDFEFAKKYNLEIKQVIIPAKSEIQKDKMDSQDKLENDKIAFTDYGVLVNSEEFDDLTSEVAKKKITEKLKEINAGDFKINYKLRDWVFSRQHYWGEPIPIIHCEKCGEVPVPEAELPLELPQVEHYEPTDTGESPLVKITDWVNTTCPKCGGKAKRETDTMPNWAGSSWYFLRYIDPLNDKIFADKEKLKYWMGVDIYEGGPEHITLHLLYSRFWNEFLFDIGEVPTSEPYKKRILHGMILAEDGKKMSKSLGNTVSPDEIVKRYGADTARTYSMFIGPFEQTIAWDMNGLAGVFRFLHKVWDNVSKPDTKDNEDIISKLNILIQNVTSDIDNYHFNTAVAKMMEFNNELCKLNSIPLEVKEKLIIILSPFAPHISEEMWQIVGNDKILLEMAKWPEVDISKIVKKNITIPVQINGKIRDMIELNSDADEEESRACLERPNVKKYLDGQKIKKYIYIQSKIISIVLE
jgi:leucyl-tRNA synthetase